MMSENVLRKTFDSVARYAGFSKHSGAWYLRQAETVAVIELQKSQYGPQYYLNVALWLLPLGDSQFPREEKCHVRTRLTRLFPELEGRLKQILDLQFPMDESIRGTELRDMLERLLLPALKECSTIRGLQGRGGDLLLKSSLVTRAAQQLLGLEQRKTPYD